MQSLTKKIFELILEDPSDLERFNSIQNLPNLYQAIGIFNDAINTGLKNDINSCLESLKDSLLKKKEGGTALASEEIEKCSNDIVKKIQDLYISVIQKGGLNIQSKVETPENG